MASPVRLYQEEMHGNLGFFATWLPGDPIEVGDVGVLENGRFRCLMSLRELGIGCDLRIGQSTQNVQYTSTQGTKITISAGALATALAKAEITIEFSREGAFIFNASSLRPQRLENRTTVAEKILQAYKTNKWKKEWLLVDALHSAECATIIVSEDNTAGLVLAANANVPLSAISLADPKIELKVVSTRGRILHIIAGKELHPLYSCLRLKDPLFGEPSVQPVRGIATVNGETPMFRPGIDELLNS